LANIQPTVGATKLGLKIKSKFLSFAILIRELVAKKEIYQA